MRSRRRTRRPAVEALEARLCMAAPTPYPGTPLTLPTDGTWRQTPFVGSPIFSDLNGDGRDELITAASGGRLLAFSTDPNGATRLFQVYKTGAEANFKSTPVVLTVSGVGKVIFAALGRDESNEYALEDGRVFAFNAVTGAILPGWPQDTDRPPPDARRSSGVTGALATGDLDGDGIPEVVVTSFSKIVTAFKLDGSKLWEFANDETVEPGAVVADLDGDGKAEVVYSSGISPSVFYPAGGMITILNSNGSQRRRIFTGEVFFGSPLLADLNNDGTLEIIGATGPYFNTVATTPAGQAAARAAGNRIYAFDLQGNLVPGWPYHTTTNDALDRQTWKEPIAADLDGDGRPEIIAVDRVGVLHVVAPNGKALPGFEGGKVINPVLSGRQFNDAFSSPIVADVNGDGSQDVIVSHGYQLRAYSRFGAEVFSAFTPTTPGTGIPEATASAAAVGQFDGKGGLELAFVSASSASPGPPRSVLIYQLPPSTATPSWPLHRRDAQGRAIQQSWVALGSFVDRTYAGLLGRLPTAAEKGQGVGVLLTNTVTQLDFARFVISKPGGLARWGGSLDTSDGAINARFLPLFQTLGYAAIPNDSLAALAFDGHRGTSPVEAAVKVVGSRGNYAATNLIASWVRGIFRGVYDRQANTDETANVIRVFDAGSVDPGGVVRYLLNSPEARIHYVQLQVRDLLGREATPNDLNAYAFYSRREDVTRAILGSPEYFNRSGGTIDGFVRASFQSVFGFAAPDDQASYYINQINGGQLSIPNYLTSLIDNNLSRERFVVDALYRYTPENDRGVLRLPLGLTGSAITPNPNFVNYYVNLLAAGARQEDVLTSLIYSFPFILSSSYDRGLYQSRGIRR